MSIKKWILPKQNPQLMAQLAGTTQLPALPLAILCARGYDNQQDIAQMLNGGILADPYELADMDKAVKRIRAALRDGQKIAVYGDYDCDGITSTALLVSYLQSVGADTIYYIPSREKEGYGLNKGAVDFLNGQKVRLVITVDNGISSHGEVAYAASLGMDVVITDHHTPRETLPQAVAVVNPHRLDCPSAFKHLAGVGVAFKLVCALEEAGSEELLEYYSDIVTLGTIADVVALTGENRIIVRHGLEHLSQSERPGLLALMRVSGLSQGNITSENVAFGLVPRINAAGRMGCVDDAVELLLTDDVSHAQTLAASIDAQNEERKKIETDMGAEIDGILSRNPQILSRRVLVLSGIKWHHGIVGIVAAKVLEKYGKPAILFSVDGQEARGSGRSIQGFSLVEAISACSEHLTQYGGHTLAAGLTVPAEKLEAFTGQFLSYADENFPVMPVPTCSIDCVVEPENLRVEAMEPLSILEPFGQGNKAPLFLVQDMKIEGVYPTADKKHIRIRLARGGESLYAVYFRMNEEQFPYRAGDSVDVVANCSVGEYNGKAQLSVKIKDLRLSGVPQEDILTQREWYACFCNGKISCAVEALYPDRGDFAVIYKFLRTAGGFRFDVEELYYRLLSSGMEYSKMCVALDVLEEMGLIARGGAVSKTVIRLLPAAQKVNMDSSQILMRLK